MARKNWQFQTPDTRLAHIQYARQVEEERAKRLDAQDAERMTRIQGEMQVEQERSAGLDRQDTVQEELRFEEKRKADLDVAGAPQYEPGGRVLPEEAAPYLRQMGPRVRQWEQGIFPVPGEPMYEPRGELPSAEMTPLERTIQRRWEGGVGEGVAAREITPPGVPFALGRPLEYVAERFLDPAAAAGLQLAESPAGAGLPSVPELKAVTRGAEQLGIPESYMPTPRTRTFEEAYAGGPVNVFAAAWGSEEEQEKAQAVLEEAGLPRAMAARVVFDLTWALPGAGVTKIDDVVRLVRLGGKAGGAARARVLSNPTLQRFVKTVKSEAGGPRVLRGLGAEVGELPDFTESARSLLRQAERAGQEITPQTLADARGAAKLRGTTMVEAHHVAEALQYRGQTITTLRARGADKAIIKRFQDVRKAAQSEVLERPELSLDALQRELRLQQKAHKATPPGPMRESVTQNITDLQARIARLQVAAPAPAAPSVPRPGEPLPVQPAEGGSIGTRESAMVPPQADEAVPRLDAPEVMQAAETGDVHNALQRMVADSLEGGGLPPRKPPYTAARTGPPDDAGGALAAASGAPPGRVATDLWRQWEGRMNEAIDRVVRLEGGDAYQQARKQGVKISKTRTPESETVMEKFWLRDSVESFDEKWRPLAKRLYGMLDEEEALMLAADPSFSNKLLDKYFPHLFKVRERGGMPPPGKLGQKPGFMRERKLEGPLGDILEANPELDLYSWDPVDFVLRRRLAGEQYRANLEVLQRMKAGGLALKRSAAPADWVVPNAPAFQSRAIPGRPDMFTSPIAVPKDVAKVMNDWYGTSFMTTNAAFNFMRRGAITAKFTKVFGGLFQYFDYTMRTLGISTGYQEIRGIPGIARAWARAWVPGVERKLLRFDIENPVRNRLIKDGLNVRGPTDIVEATFRQSYSQDVLPIPLLKQMTEFLTSRAYTGLHREMVLTNAETLFRHYRGQGLDEAAASVKAVRKTHEFFSTLPAWQSIWRSPGMRDVMRTFGLFSMGETEGWFRNFFRLFQPTQAKDAARFWFGMMAVTAGLANGINMAVTGKPLTTEQWLPFTYDKDDRRGIPYIGYNTNFMRPELPFEGPYGRKEHLDLLGQADTPFRWALDPIFGLQTRLAQYPQWGINALLLSKGEKPLFGRRPQTPGEYGEFAVGQVAPIPGMGFLQERERIGVWGGGIQAGGFNVSAEPLRNVIARKFEEKHGRPFNPETDFRIVEQDAEFKPILAELNRLGLEFESEGALRAQAIERTRLQLEEGTGLISTAEGIAGGKEGAEAEFARAFDDYNTQMVGAYAVTYLDVEDKRETPEGKKLQAYLALEMESFRDPETLEVDRDAFYAEKDKLFAELPRDLQEAIEAALRSENSTVRRYEPEFEKAKLARNEIYEQPKYPIDPEKEKVLFEFLDFVRQEWERGKREYGESFPSLPELARLIGRKNNEQWLGENAADVFSGKAPLNKGRIDLAMKHQVLLSRYFPDVLRRVLPVEFERGGLGEEAFERMTAR